MTRRSSVISRAIGAAVAAAMAAALCPPAFAETDVPVARAASTLSIDPKTANACLPTTVENFSRHAVVRLPVQGYAVVVQRFEVGSGCFEGFRPASVSVYAKALDVRNGKTADKPLWSFETQGISGEIAEWPANSLYRIDMPGCCGAKRTQKFFSLRTGKLVASSTSALLSVETGKERELRFLAVEDNIASSPMAPKDSKGALATLFFGDAEGVRETVAIEADTGSRRQGWSAEVSWKGRDAAVKHLSSDAAAGATVVVTLNCLCDAEPVRVEIPVTADGLDDVRAQVVGMPGLVLHKTGRDVPPRRTLSRSAGEATPASAAQAFFDFLLTPKTNIATDLDAQKRWLAEGLRRQLADTTARVKAARKAPEADGPDPALPDNGVFLDSWDFPTVCRVAEVPEPAGRNEAQVDMLCEWGLRTNYPGMTRAASVTLAREGELWRIADIRMRKSKYAAEVTLLQELANLRRDADELLKGDGEGRR